ncbi:MAG: hypothetical protein DME25_03445, partial [Verrucomicrobia bacterium]
YEMHDGIVELVLRTFSSAFPFVEIWDAGNGDIILLGSVQPWPSNAASYRRSFDIPGVRSDLAKIGISSPELLWARQMASQRTAFAIAGDGPVQSDLFPVLEYAAPRAFYIGVTAKSFQNYDERTRQVGLAPADKIAALKSLSPSETLALFVSFSTVNKELFDTLADRGEGANAPCVFQKRRPVVPEGPKETDSTLERAKAALNAGDLTQSAQLAALAVKENQTDPVAGYLMRIVERQQILTRQNVNQ